jgi:hypothetical protein
MVFQLLFEDLEDKNDIPMSFQLALATKNITSSSVKFPKRHSQQKIEKSKPQAN